MGTNVTPPRIISFQEALAQAEVNKHVLLGNGFSRACRNDIFAYDALFDRADFNGAPLARQAFTALGTRDFEAVMRALRSAALLVEVYEANNAALAASFRREAETLRNILANAIAQNHPDRPSDIADERYRACRLFLEHFSKIYSVNYDLLLYWALMHDELLPLVRCDDGFRTPEAGNAEYVTWEPENRLDQNVLYLHGALHLFDSGAEIQKYTWINTGIRLIDQIRDALGRNLFPLIVAEGTSESKKEKILHSMYLSHAYKSMLGIGGSLFIHGLAMHENDDHIGRLIVKNQTLRSLFVGVFGNPASDENARMIRRYSELVARRRRYQVIHFFDAASAHVWD